MQFLSAVKNCEALALSSSQRIKTVLPQPLSTSLPDQAGTRNY